MVKYSYYLLTNRISITLWVTALMPLPPEIGSSRLRPFDTLCQISWFWTKRKQPLRCINQLDYKELVLNVSFYVLLISCCRILDMRVARNCRRISKFSFVQWPWWFLTDRYELLKLSYFWWSASMLIFFQRFIAFTLYVTSWKRLFVISFPV